jgi:hypothetical protein
MFVISDSLYGSLDIAIKIKAMHMLWNHHIL